MGRFGNMLLTNGETSPSFRFQLGEVVRFYLTNTANTRVFNVGIRDARMKLIGSDSGRYEHEALVDAVLLAPSERAVVDVLFDESGTLTLEHRTPARSYTLAAIVVASEPIEPRLKSSFVNLRSDAADLAAERGRLAEHLDAEPEKTLAPAAEV